MGLNKQEEAKLLPAYGRKRILLLADAYRELSYSFRIMEEESPTGVMDRRELVFQKALRDNRKIMEQRLQEMATYMEELAEESLSYSEPNARKVRILKNGLAKHGILLKEIYLIRRKGAMQFVLTMRGQRNADYTTDDIAEVLTEMFGFPLVSAKENLFFVAYEYDTYIYECKGRFEFQTGIASATKENEAVSGDNYLVYSVSGTKKVCMISDGAGSGEEACRDSERVLELAEKYMDTGFAMTEVTDMINSLFVAHGREQNMPTLDACIVDLAEGTVFFRKYGACDSFIRRKESIERIKNTGYPLGFSVREAKEEKGEEVDMCWMLQEIIDEGKTFPDSSTTVDAMFADGEVVMNMSYGPFAVATGIANGTYTETTQTFVFDKGTIGNTNYMAIAFNAPNKAGAMVCINAMISAELQLSMYEELKGLPVTDPAKLSAEEAAAFDAVEIGQGVLSSTELLTHRLPEMPAKLVPVIEQIWLDEVVGK